eukprot:TRINITY_DN10324_c0_g2_i1.p1 TRINITY_DN10324_c0_g2~~TRINITY_DN10324_c0_g2_i1.p1  ORF type:complete len:506 (+),score=81.94 TRINITY_DN10324_c0_g2_i1:1757-3274(+)
MASVYKQTELYASHIIDDVVARMERFVLHCWYHPVFQVLRKAMLTTFVVVMVFNCMLALATCLYSAFYYLYVPTASYEWPLYFNYHHQQPVTILPLGLASDTRVLSRNQGYHFYVELDVPLSRHNINAGVFMVTLRLLHDQTDALSQPLRQYLVADSVAKDAPTASLVTTQSWDPSRALVTTPDALPLASKSASLAIARPAMLTYRSWPVRAIRTWLLLVPIALGVWTETETLRIPLFQDLVDHAEHPYLWARVELSHPGLQVSEARLVAKANMKGLSYWMYHWYMSSFVVAVTSLAGVFTLTSLLVILGLFWEPLSAFYTLEQAPAPKQPQPVAPAGPMLLDNEPSELVRDPLTGLDVFPADYPQRRQTSSSSSARLRHRSRLSTSDRNAHQRADERMTRSQNQAERDTNDADDDKDNVDGHDNADDKGDNDSSASNTPTADNSTSTDNLGNPNDADITDNADQRQLLEHAPNMLLDQGEPVMASSPGNEDQLGQQDGLRRRRE